MASGLAFVVTARRRWFISRPRIRSTVPWRGRTVKPRVVGISPDDVHVDSATHPHRSEAMIRVAMIDLTSRRLTHGSVRCRTESGRTSCRVGPAILLKADGHHLVDWTVDDDIHWGRKREVGLARQAGAPAGGRPRDHVRSPPDRSRSPRTDQPGSTSRHGHPGTTSNHLLTANRQGSPTPRLAHFTAAP